LDVHQGMFNAAPPSQDDARHRHRRLCEASRAALASAEFRQILDALKSRCEAAPVITVPRPQTDITFDSNRERTEGWTFEPIGNVFA
jgi:hypothetical protein